MIDVLRASTTIITALANGAHCVRPVLTIEEARDAAACGLVLLGGERGGRPIEGFDLGNSPIEYSRQRVAGRDVVITTTNGTAAIHACESADTLLIGAVVNRSAVANRALQHRRDGRSRNVHLVCAGSGGVGTEEDRLGAGAILDAAVRAGVAESDLEASGLAALSEFRSIIVGGPDAPIALAHAFTRSVGGRNLIDIGMESDLRPAAAIDSLSVVPRLDRPTGWLLADRPDSA